MFEFKLPDIGEGVHEGEIAKWLVNAGDSIIADAPMVEVMTDKVTVEITSPVSGTVNALHYQEGTLVKVGQVIVSIDESNGAKQSPITSPQAESNTTAVTSANKPSNNHKAPEKQLSNKIEPSTDNSTKGNCLVLATPAVRKLAREKGIQLSQIKGTGPNGRIQKTDLEQPPISPLAYSSTRQSTGLPQATDKRIPFKGMRRKIAEHLVHSKQTAPHFTYVEEADLTALVDARKQLIPVAEAVNVKLTYLPFMIKAVIAAMQSYPILNSSLDETAQEIILKGSYNIGVAVATPDGLIVPVVHDAGQMSLFELANAIEQLSLKARQNKLTLSDMKDGTFTLTSIGSIGGIFSAPIINYPEVAIMGIQKIEKRPVVRDNQIVIREMCYLSISCDHRVVDGSDAALFMKEVIQYLEAPVRLLSTCTVQ